MIQNQRQVIYQKIEAFFSQFRGKYHCWRFGPTLIQNTLVKSIKRSYALLIFGSAFLLVACAESEMNFRSAAPVAVNQAINSIPIALVSIEGGSEAINSQFSAYLTEALSRDHLQLVPLQSAQFLIRGYLNAYKSEEETTVGYVWDIFEKDKLSGKRIARTEDGIILKKNDVEPWSLASDALLRSLAARSADELAAYLGTITRVNKDTTAPVPGANGSMAYTNLQSPHSL